MKLGIDEMYKIHPSALTVETYVVLKDVKLGAQCHIIQY